MNCILKALESKNRRGWAESAPPCNVGLRQKANQKMQRPYALMTNDCLLAHSASAEARDAVDSKSISRLSDLLKYNIAKVSICS